MAKRAWSRLWNLRSERYAFAVIALALYWAMFRRPFLGTVFSQGAPELHESFLFFHMIVIALGVSISLVPSALASIFARSSWIGVISGFAMMLGIMALRLPGLVPSVASVAVIVAPPIIAVGFIGVGAQCVALCGKLGEEAPLVLAVSFLASFAIGLVELVPSGAFYAAPLIPSLCGLMLLRSLSSVPSAASSGRCAGASTLSGTADWSRAIAVSGAAVMAAMLLAGACVRSIWLYDAVGYMSTARGALTYACSVVIAAAIAIIILRVRSERTALLSCLVLLAVALLSSVALCSLSAAGRGGSLVTSACTSIQFCLWMFLVPHSKDDQERSLSFGTFLCIVWASSLLEAFVLPQILGIEHGSADQLMLPLGFAGMSAVCLVGTVIVVVGLHRLSAPTSASEVRAVGGERGGSLGAEESFGRSEATSDAASFARAFGLTNREAEVAAYLAQGHSVKRIAELLCIAPSTVQSFSKSIYRKAGIHSKQDLIDLWGDLRGEGSPQEPSSQRATERPCTLVSATLMSE